MIHNHQALIMLAGRARVSRKLNRAAGVPASSTGRGCPRKLQWVHVRNHSLVR